MEAAAIIPLGVYALVVGLDLLVLLVSHMSWIMIETKDGQILLLIQC